jgi:hypothetical protein
MKRPSWPLLFWSWRPCLARWVFLSTWFIGAGLARQASNFVLANFAAQSKRTPLRDLCLAKESHQRRALEYKTSGRARDAAVPDRFCIGFVFCFSVP